MGKLRSMLEGKKFYALCLVLVAVMLGADVAAIEGADIETLKNVIIVAMGAAAKAALDRGLRYINNNLSEILGDFEEGDHNE